MSGHKGNWTKLTGINLPGLSDWIDRYIFFFTGEQRACLKRIITEGSSMSKCKMPIVDMQGSCTVQWDGTLFGGIPQMTA